MAIKEILKFPDPRLRRVAKPVTSVTAQLSQLASDMLETMYEAKGIGLAAPQVGEDVRLLVMDTRPKHQDDESESRYKIEEMTELEKQVSMPLAIFNPELKTFTGKTTFEEGCLSVPTFFETVERFNYVEVTGLDASGKPIHIKTDGLTAICLQHEMDHLDGKLFIDRLSLIKSNLIKTRIKKHGYPSKDSKEEMPL